MKDLQQNIDDAIKAKDANKLDLALRAMYHYMHRGKSVDTSMMQFPEVLAINPKFYG
jgi:hypothetical protein